MKKGTVATVTEVDFTPAQIELLQKTIAEGATKDELALFIGQCKRTKLDPFTRQIYFIKSGGRVMTQISVDGFRVIAERSGDYAGQDEPTFTETSAGIVKCSVTVYRWHGDTRYAAAVGVAYWKEYAKSSGTWSQMPHTMLAKVAECIALRKAFPNDLSGLYSAEEMDQAAVTVEANAKPTPVQKLEPVIPEEPVAPTTVTNNGNPKGTITPAQLKAIYAVANELSINEERLNEMTIKRFGCRVSGLSKEDATGIIDKLMEAPRPKLDAKKLAEYPPEEPAATADEIIDSLPPDMGGHPNKCDHQMGSGTATWTCNRDLPCRFHPIDK